MCFQSELHPNVKQNRRDELTRPCFQNHIPATVNNDITALLSGAAPRQPSAVSDQTKQQGRAKMKPRHQTRQQGGREREGGHGDENKRRGKNEKIQLRSCHESDKKAIVSGIWVNNSGLAVKLSLSKCKSAIRECTCVCVSSRDCDQCDSESVRQFFHISFLSLCLSPLSCVFGLDLSPQSMSLFPHVLWRDHSTACRRKQVWNEKGQITREWWNWGEKRVKRRKTRTDNGGRGRR